MRLAFSPRARRALIAMLLLCVAASDFLHAAPANQPAAAPATAQKGPLLRSRKLSESIMTSRQGRQHRVLVTAPSGTAPKNGFPVLYVLDADGWFGSAVEIVKIREYEKLTPTIVVGVASPKHFFFDPSRSYDFTPPGSADPDFEGIELGGADEFLAFLDGTLKPWVRSHYRADAARQILFGHSLGGLFALHAMFREPDAFAVYLAASPHIGFSDKAILHEATAFQSNPKRQTPRLLVTVGELEAHPSPELVDDYRRYFAEHPEAIPGQSVAEAIDELFHEAKGDFDKRAETRALVERLAASGVKASLVQFAGEEHMSAAVSALNRGIPFALRPEAGKQASEQEQASE
jgi:predicted alpha/beta superfamily hydrolase